LDNRIAGLEKPALNEADTDKTEAQKFE